MWLKDLFKPFFANELQQLAKCRDENIKLKVEISELKDVKPIIKEKIILPREFKSKNEMLLWFNKNKISQSKYVKDDFDCDNFSFETQIAALKDGFIVNMELDMSGWYYKNGGAHMLCGCKIGNMYYIVEPQNDRIIYETRLD